MTTIRPPIAPLIGQLSNPKFLVSADKVLASGDVEPVGGRSQLCRCGCGSEVAAGRKFVSQTHYDRFRALPLADAEQLVACFHQGVPKRQLGHEYGIALTRVKRALRRHRG
jgi:hypothetical protein